jgi:MFS family permease
MVDRRPDPSSPFAVPLFRSVWVASMASNFGGQIQAVGASWLMISLAGTPLLVALVQASTALPLALLSLVAGAMADSLDRRRVMLAAQTFMLLVSLTLAVLAWLELLTPWLLLTMTFLLGCGIALNAPCWQASIGDIVPRAAIPRAVALNSMGFNVARSFGPALGGGIVAAVGAAAAFVINALSYIGFIVVLWRWKPNIVPETLPRERIGNAVLTGLRYVSMSPAIGVVLVRASLFGIGASAVPALMPLVARDLVGGGALTYGVLLGGFGIGAVVGALGSARLRGRTGPERVVRIATGLAAAGAAGIAAGWGLVPTVLALAMAGAGWVIALSTFNVTVQLSAPRWVTGRALSIYQMAAFAGMTLGAWAFGTLAVRFYLPTALLVAAVWLTATVLVGLVLPMRGEDELDLTPLDRWTEPETVMQIDGRSGPIVVMIEYEIREADVPAFLEVMNERRRVRRRDGAHGWSLARDLGAPQYWVERYQVPTWFDYVRHNRRRTQEDATNLERLNALHSGDAPPRIRRTIERQTSGGWQRDSHAARELAAPLTDTTSQA